MNATNPNIGRLIADALAAGAAAPAVDWTKIDTPIRHEGRQITLPADPGRMDYDDAIDTIGRVRDQENQEFDVREHVIGAPWDTLVAVYLAVQDIYGVVIAESIKTFFGEIRPDFITVVTGTGDADRVQVPQGRMSLPGVSNPIHVAMGTDGTFITGVVRKRDRAILVEIANRARRFIGERSVYKGKAIRINVDDDGDLDLGQQPEFIDLSNVAEGDIIHTAETEALIRTNIFAPLKHTAACRANRIPLKRGILLEGKYGTGKSLTARVAAKVATDNGWTFLMLNRSQGLKAAIEFARSYQPCVIFAEDIDRAADREDEDVNDLVNLLDGMISKSMEMMVVLTTNFIDKIDASLLRPGRFDAVISIDAPDAEAAQRIIRSYARDLLPAEADLTSVGDACAGMIPASIREVVERAKLAMLTEDRKALTPEDLRISAIGMKRHMALLEPKSTEKSPAEMFAEGFMGLIGSGLDMEGVASTAEVLDARNKVIARIIDHTKPISQLAPVVLAGAGAAAKAADNTDKLLDKKRAGGGGAGLLIDPALRAASAGRAA